MTLNQLTTIITELSRALDERKPDCMCQVSPRTIAVALEHFEGMKKVGERAAHQNMERTG